MPLEHSRRDSLQSHPLSPLLHCVCTHCDQTVQLYQRLLRLLRVTNAFSPHENNDTFRASFILGLVNIYLYMMHNVLNTHSHACLCVQWKALLDGIIQRCTWIWRSFQQLLDLHHQNICDQETMATISGALASWKQGQRNVFRKPALVLKGVTPHIKGKHGERCSGHFDV